jgi:hypothetical protein
MRAAVQSQRGDVVESSSLRRGFAMILQKSQLAETAGEYNSLLRSFFSVAAALFMLNLAQKRVRLSPASTDRVLESTYFKHEHTGSGHNFHSANSKCKSIPKLPYLSGTVTYEDGQTAIFQNDFAQIYFLLFFHLHLRLS